MTKIRSKMACIAVVASLASPLSFAVSDINYINHYNNTLPPLTDSPLLGKSPSRNPSPAPANDPEVEIALVLGYLVGYYQGCYNHATVKLQSGRTYQMEHSICLAHIVGNADFKKLTKTNQSIILEIIRRVLDPRAR